MTVDPHDPPRALAAPPTLTLSEVDPSAERQCGDRVPAPGDLGLVQAFVNSFYDLEARHDRFSSPDALARWMAEHGLLAPGVALSPADRQRALDVREGVRALLFANNGADADLDAIERLNGSRQKARDYRRRQQTSRVL